MKKFLLTALAIIAMCMTASAQKTVTATSTPDETWMSYFGITEFAQINNDLTVELYDGYVVIKEWLGEGCGQDLKVAFDEDDNVTSVTEITDGTEGNSYTSGYATFSSKGGEFTTAQLYLADGYAYAGYDEESGYVMLVGYFTNSEVSQSYMLYNLEWGAAEEEEDPDLLYTAEAESCIDEDWDSSFDAFVQVDNPLTVKVYEDYVIIKNWLGENCPQDLKVSFDENESVTAIATIENGEETEIELNEGYASFSTNDPTYYYAQICLVDGYAYAGQNDDGGYVILSGSFYTADNQDGVWSYYNIEWENPLQEEVELGEFLYSANGYTTEYDDWAEEYDGAFKTTDPMQVDVYENNAITLNGWSGVEGHDMTIIFDENANITRLILLKDGEKEGSTREGYINTYTGDDTYYYANLYVGEGYSYAFADANDGYVLIPGTFYNTDNVAYDMYLYVEFNKNLGNVENISIVNDSPVEYYNINGIRVANPSLPGIYITRQGNKVSKQIIK